MSQFKAGLFAVGLAFGIAGNAGAAITFEYTGNSFDAIATPPQFLGRHIVASVTFDDSVAGLTGTVGVASILSWSIELDQVAGTRRDNTTGVLNSSWPIWFQFSGGAITGWQLLADTGIDQEYPEIYTTHNSPFSRIYPTADYYATVNTGATLWGTFSPGTWTSLEVVTAVPEPESYAMLLAGLGVLGFAVRRRKLKMAAG